MPALETEQHGLAPAEQYLRAFWHARYQFLLIVAAFVAGSLVANQVLPKVYSSQTLVSVKQSPQLDSAGLLYDTVMSNRGEKQNDPGELFARRYLKRFHANRTVTLAAQDAGLVEGKTGLEERDINRWIDLELIEKTDLIAVTVNQPTPEGAQRFAEKLLSRVEEVNQEENTAAATRKMLSAEVARAQADVAAAETRFVEASHFAAQTAAQKVAQDRVAMELELARKTYAPLKKRLDAIALILAEQQLQLYVVDPPTMPLRPSFPRPLLNVSIGLILGMLTGTVMVVLRGIFSGSPPRLR